MAREGYRTNERIIPICLTACFLVLAPRFLGISFGDDAYYLWAGDTMKVSALFGSQDWSPLYCLWFKLLSVFIADPLERFFASWAILVAAAALLPTFLKMRSAWVYCFVLIGIPFLTAYPYVGLFASVIVLAGTCLILRREWALSDVLAMVCGFSFVLSFCRPEYSFCVYLSAAGTLIALALDMSGHPLLQTTAVRPRRRLLSGVIAIAVVSMATAVYTIGAQHPSTRSGLAFAQHYNRRAADRGLIPKSVDVWASGYAEQSFGIDMGHTAANGTASMGDFLRASPRLFLGHVLSNLVDPRTLVFLCLVLALVAWPWLRQDAKRLRAASVWVALVSIPPLTGMIVIYPRDHYAIILLPSLLLYTMQLIQPERWIKPSVPWAVGLGCGLGCGLIWLLNLGLPRLRHAAVPFERTNLLRAECIRGVDRSADPANPNVFDISSMTGVYLVHPRTVTRAGDLAQWPQFTGWVAATHPAWIALDPWLAAPYNKTPAEVQAFLSGELGYTAHPCPPQAYLTIYTRDKP